MSRPIDTRLLILEALDHACRKRKLCDFGDIQWESGQLVRLCAQLANRGDPQGWEKWLSHLRTEREAAAEFLSLFEKHGWVKRSIADRKVVITLTLPSEFAALADSDAADLLASFGPQPIPEDERPALRNQKAGEVMYIEQKPGLAGPARIGRVTFSATRKTIYYAGYKLQSLKGGYKANYFDVDSGLYFWISNCKKEGNDTLYPGVVEIDEDAREEYWTEIRKLPENRHLTRVRSEGKHAKRRPS